MKNKVEYVISLAKNDFVSGNEIRKRITGNELTRIQYGYANGRRLPAHPRVIERAFGNYNANTIPNSQLIVSAGPYQDEMESFIQDVLCNPHHPIKAIVALGGTLAYNTKTYQDFYDYCVVAILNGGPVIRQFGEYEISVLNQSGTYHSSLNKHQVMLDSIIKSTIQIKKAGTLISEIEFNLIPSEGKPFKLDEKVEGRYQPTTQEIWNIIASLQNKKTLIHCASGHGRSGFFTLLIEVLKNYKTIFSNPNPQECAYELLKTLARVRKNRRCIATSFEHFEAAVSNAEVLYRFALENKYDLTGVVSKKPGYGDKQVIMPRTFDRKPVVSDSKQEYQSEPVIRAVKTL